MNYQRRTFRGRGGATDRRLPKYNARRRRRKQQQKSIDPKDKIDNESHSSSSSSSSSSESPIIFIACIENMIDSHREAVEDLSENDHNNIDETKSGERNINCSKEEIPMMVNKDPDSLDEYSDDDDDNKYDNKIKYYKNDNDNKYLPFEEIKCLKRKIRNVQEISIQTSRDAIAANPTAYQENVLNATQNCVNQWRSIVRYYKDDVGLSSELRNDVCLAVFQLIQLSIQSGPLSGAKPGYFKRCGTKVAKMALDFLDKVVPQYEALGNLMGFSSKQMDIMKKWKTNAEKAVQKNTSPSKSVTKCIQQGQQQKKQKGNKKNKKK